jgi:hypothetical protein
MLGFITKFFTKSPKINSGLPIGVPCLPIGQSISQKEPAREYPEPAKELLSKIAKVIDDIIKAGLFFSQDTITVSIDSFHLNVGHKIATISYDRLTNRVDIQVDKNGLWSYVSQTNSLLIDGHSTNTGKYVQALIFLIKQLGPIMHKDWEDKIQEQLKETEDYIKNL